MAFGHPHKKAGNSSSDESLDRPVENTRDNSNNSQDETSLNEETSERNTIFSESIFSKTKSKLTFNTNSSSMFSGGRNFLKSGQPNATGVSNSSETTSSSSFMQSSGFEDDVHNGNYPQDNSIFEREQQHKGNTMGKPLRVSAPLLTAIEENDSDSLQSEENQLAGGNSASLFNENTNINTTLGSPHINSRISQTPLGNLPTISDNNMEPLAQDVTIGNSPKREGSGTCTNVQDSALGKSHFPTMSNKTRTNSSSDSKSDSSIRTKQFSLSGRKDNIPNVEKESTDNSSRLTPEFIEKEIRILDENLITIIDDIHQNVVNISRATIQATEFFKDFLPLLPGQRIPFKVKTAKNSSLRSIIKAILHFNDNLLASEVYQTSKAILFSKFVEFLKKLNIDLEHDDSNASPNNNFNGPHAILPSLKIYALDDNCLLPNKTNVTKIIEEITKADSKFIADQNGAFIASLIRGVSMSSAIVTVMFGIPNLHQEHFEMIKSLYSIFPDVHFYCVKDYIKSASASTAAPFAYPLMNTNTPEQEQKNTTNPPMMHHTQHASSSPPQNTLFPTYRLPSDYSNPPISLSLSIADSQKITGTLGGYLYPKIAKDNKNLKHFENSTFAITCAHVVLSESQDYADVAVPSTVLQTKYKNDLIDASMNYKEASVQRQAYNQEIEKVDATIKWQQKNKFGQVVWGERSIIDKKLSDFAIIKLNDAFIKIKNGNYLGEDLAYSIPDPSLRFDNLYVTETIDNFENGADVFKYGSTTGYTKGKINGSKLVFWADGKIQSSEFVIASPTAPLFATGGDSGAWILSKLGKDKLGLGVVGMLHSYDGELKQFGLFTPIKLIFERLKTVTGVEWDIKRAHVQK